MNAITLLIPGDVAEMTPNRKMHYRERDRLRDKWKLLARSAWNEADGRMFTVKVWISFTVYRGRVLDEDNLRSSLAFKAIIDALKGRAYVDDSPRYVGITQMKEMQITGERYRQCPAVLVTLEPLEEKVEPSG